MRSFGSPFKRFLVLKREISENGYAWWGETKITTTGRRCKIGHLSIEKMGVELH